MLQHRHSTFLISTIVHDVVRKDFVSYFQELFPLIIEKCLVAGSMS